MTTRKISNEKKYIKFRKQNKVDGCNFCKFITGDGQVVHEFNHFWLVKNIFGYDVWDSFDVIDHLMLVPKKHTESISNLSDEAMLEYAKILSKYEKDGYSIYARSMQNVGKTVPHQHTHLLKLGTKQKSIYLFIRKPYILLYK